MQTPNGCLTSFAFHQKVGCNLFPKLKFDKIIQAPSHHHLYDYFDDIAGWYTTGKMLLPFKTGAFKPGRPVQPYILKWDTEFNPTVTTYGQNISWFWTAMLTLAQPRINLTITGLPVYHPSEGTIFVLSSHRLFFSTFTMLIASAERQNPELYASNVSQLMSKMSGLPLCKKSGWEYLREIGRMREQCPDMNLSGWKGLFACASEMQASTHERCKDENHKMPLSSSLEQ